MAGLIRRAVRESGKLLGHPESRRKSKPGVRRVAQGSIKLENPLDASVCGLTGRWGLAHQIFLRPGRECLPPSATAESSGLPFPDSRPGERSFRYAPQSRPAARRRVPHCLRGDHRAPEIAEPRTGRHATIRQQQEHFYHTPGDLYVGQLPDFCVRENLTNGEVLSGAEPRKWLAGAVRWSL